MGVEHGEVADGTVGRVIPAARQDGVHRVNDGRALRQFVAQTGAEIGDIAGAGRFEVRRVLQISGIL